jgi:poly-gamma-glutamate synthesis protein (capsule biosynthesis protein)
MLQDYEQPVCHALIDAGADAVIGNHAHELHGMEVYKERPIAYCLGNFWIGSLSDYAWMERETVIWELTFTPGSSVPAVSLRTLKMNEAGLPEIDATGTAANLLSERSEGIQFSKLGDARYQLVAR